MRFIFLLFLVISSQPILAETQSLNERCPGVAGMQMFFQLSQEAQKYRSEGKPKSYLTNVLPPKSSANDWRMSIMYEIADEVFDYPPLEPFVYSVYKGELCFIYQHHPEILSATEFSPAHSLLKECSNFTQQKEKTVCAMGVAHKITNTMNDFK